MLLVNLCTLLEWPLSLESCTVDISFSDLEPTTLFVGRYARALSKGALDSTSVRHESLLQAHRVVRSVIYHSPMGAS